MSSSFLQRLMFLTRMVLLANNGGKLTDPCWILPGHVDTKIQCWLVHLGWAVIFKNLLAKVKVNSSKLQCDGSVSVSTCWSLCLVLSCLSSCHGPWSSSTVAIASSSPARPSRTMSSSFGHSSTSCCRGFWEVRSSSRCGTAARFWRVATRRVRLRNRRLVRGRRELGGLRAGDDGGEVREVGHSG